MVRDDLDRAALGMLIYIMGRPHSGSTILDIVLGNSAAIESVGELISGLEFAARGHRCACGERMLDCPYWARVRAAFEARAKGEAGWAAATSACVAQAHVRSLLRTLLAPARSGRLAFVGAASARLGQAVSAVSGKPHVLDSSKEPTRGLMLLRSCPEARVIHLVRDPRRAVGSHYWRFKQHGGYFHFLRHKYYAPRLMVPFMLVAAASWTIGNLICELGRRFAPRRSIRVRYEDLCDQPTAELQRIGRAFNLPLDDLLAKLERGDALPIGHNVGGNEIRNDGRVTFRPERGKAHGLPRWLELLTFAVCWPLMLAYGYRLGALKQPASTPQAG